MKTEIEIIYGPPGTGKTSEIIKRIETVDKDSFVFCSYTRAAAQEGLKRLGKFNKTCARTIHSLAFEHAEVNKAQVVDWRKLTELSDLTGYQMSGKNMDTAVDIEVGDSMMALINYAGARMISPEEAYKDVNPYNFNKYEFTMFYKAYDSWKKKWGYIDFNDMLRMFVKLPPVKFKSLFIDEAQDLSNLQWACIENIDAERIYIAGDDDQCQPKGTMVQTQDGPIDISKLDPGKHKLLSYAKRDAMVYGKIKGYPFKKASRRYTGNIYTITQGNNSTKCTYGHKWLVKWSRKAKNLKNRVIYLMEKEGNFRIGHTQLFRSDGCFGPAVRSNSEKANGIWLLKVVDNMEDCQYWENYYSYKYGIPQVIFLAQRSSLEANSQLTQVIIDRIFNDLDTASSAARLLKDLGFKIEFPFWSRKRAYEMQGGSYILTLEACNLVKELMEVPIYTGTRIPGWGTIDDVTIDPVKNMTVYSLDVEKYHTYIANGIITHNSLSEWAGAHPQGMKAYAERHKVGNIIVLNKSYRVPVKVFNLANKIISRVKERHTKHYEPQEHQGRVERFNGTAQLSQRIDDSKEVLMLYRNYSVKEEIEDYLVDRGIPYLIPNRGQGRGSMFSSPYMRAVRAFEKIKSGESIGKIEMRDLRHNIARTYKTDRGVDASKIRKVSWKQALSIPYNHLAYIDRVKDIFAEPKIRLSTIHGAKGTEADQVVLLTSMGARTWEAMGCNYDAEWRVWYVGVTRSKQDLFIVDSGLGVDI